MNSVVCAVALIAAICGIINADDSIFSGFLGCRFSESVCRHNEECVDDLLFGSCQSLAEPRDNYQYALTSGELRSLEREIGGLIEAGNTWDDLYTQCVLSNILLAYRNNQQHDPNLCDNGGAYQNGITADLNDAATDLFRTYLRDYYLRMSQDNAGYQDEIDDIEKKDDVVQVHKYLKSHKRDPIISVESDYNRDWPISRDYESEDYDLSGVLKTLSSEKLALLQEYLGPGVDDFPDPDLEKSYNDYPRIPDDQDINDDSAGSSIDVKDAKLLDQLLQGSMSVSDLSDAEISVLSQYVDGILKPLRDYSENTDNVDDLESENADGLTVDTLGFPPVTDADPESQEDPEESPPIDHKEQLDVDALKTPSGNSRIHVDLMTTSGSLKHDDFQLPHRSDLLKPGGYQLPYSDGSGSLAKKLLMDRSDSAVESTTDIIDIDRVYLKIRPNLNKDFKSAATILVALKRALGLPDDSQNTLQDKVIGDDEINFRVAQPNPANLSAAEVARKASLYHDLIKNETTFDIYETGVGKYETSINVVPGDVDKPRYFVLTFVLCGVILGIVLSVIAIYVVRRHLQSKEKLAQLAGNVDGIEASNDYQDLCRQRMQVKSSEKPEPLHINSRMGSVSASEAAVRSPSSRSSTSSRSEEPVVSNMDISTGHIVLSYMEDHLKNKDRLEQEWEALCVYEAEPNDTSISVDQNNMRKNKYADILPYDHSRVVLSSAANVSGSDYINACTITDHDPRNPAYICTQGPLPHTVADFWQMVWEQGSVVIVNLTKLMENGQSLCHRYWPEEGSDLYHIYEVHLVSEHIWCDEYLVRCFYLKNLQTTETRTVSQFHFLSWPDMGVPASAKALLDFRRKVNKSFRGPHCPIVVHCSDGSGRSGSYCLLDMVLNRMSKGAKEIDIAATLEHIRDQRMMMAKTKEQFEFVLSSVAEEVHAILKSLQ